MLATDVATAHGLLRALVHPQNERMSDRPRSGFIGARQIEGQTVRLEPGDSWVVPAGAEHTYRILETFTAVEATAPPAQVHGHEQS
jgi:hypothetical protein